MLLLKNSLRKSTHIFYTRKLLLFFEELLKYGNYLIDCYLLFQLPPPPPEAGSEVDISEFAVDSSNEPEIDNFTDDENQEGKLKCSKCAETFSAESNLKIHIDIKHDINDSISILEVDENRNVL